MPPTSDDQQPTPLPEGVTVDTDDPDMEYVQVIPTEAFTDRARQASEPVVEDSPDQ